MTKLAEAQISLMEWLSNAGINNDGDQNGNKQKYRMIKEQVKRLDKIIIKLASL